MSSGASDKTKCYCPCGDCKCGDGCTCTPERPAPGCCCQKKPTSRAAEGCHCLCEGCKAGSHCGGECKEGTCGGKCMCYMLKC